MRKTIQRLSITILFFTVLNLSAQIQPIDTKYRDKVVAAIYLAEGGAKSKYPYGIKSINTKGDKEYAKKICQNTVANNYIRWQKAGKTNDFITFLGNRFCPVGTKDDPTNLNRNWVKNVNYFLKK